MVLDTFSIYPLYHVYRLVVSDLPALLSLPAVLRDKSPHAPSANAFVQPRGSQSLILLVEGSAHQDLPPLLEILVESETEI